MKLWESKLFQKRFLETYGAIFKSIFESCISRHRENSLLCCKKNGIQKSLMSIIFSAQKSNSEQVLRFGFPNRKSSYNCYNIYTVSFLYGNT